MGKVVVAIDSSKASESAAAYAGCLAEKTNSRVELVHVLDEINEGNSLKNWKKLESEMTNSARDNAFRLMNNVTNDVDITYKVLKGAPVAEAVSKYVVDEEADMVVAGSRNVTGLTKTLFGSSIIGLLNICSKPLIVVPEGYRFNGIRKIAYATDMIHLDEEIKEVVKLARPFDAEIVILHIIAGSLEKRDRSVLTGILSRMTDYNKIDFVTIGNDDVIEGIEEAVTSLKPDMLAMFTHKRDLTDKLMGRGVTRKITFQNQLPLMVINRSVAE